VERGFLPDSAPGVLIQWTIEGEGPPVDLRTGPPTDPGSGARFVLAPGEPATIALTGAALRRVTPAAARERARAGRSHLEPLRLTLEGTGPGRDGQAGATTGTLREGHAHAIPRDLLTDAVTVLDRAACGVSGDGRPEGPFLLGVAEGEPRWLSGTELAELGLGALCAGRHELALALYEELAGGDAPSPIALVHLAARLVEWTGEPRHLLGSRDALGRAVEALKSGGAGEADGVPAAFPTAMRGLDELAQAVEPLGGSWRAELLAVRDALVTAGGVHGGSAGGAPGAPRRSLPVLGGPARPDSPPPPRPAEAQLPPPEAFAPVGAASVTHRRSLHAARFVRSWVEGVLGVRPDGAWGRVTLAPDLRGVRGRLIARNLRMADALITLDCRAEGSSCTLSLSQTSGRVPVNVVFEPRIGLEAPLSVRIGEEEAEVRITPVYGGARVSCQFPLDPERRIVVEQRT
jgi:hypothetical protein